MHDEDHVATPWEAVQEYARNAGAELPGHAWLLHDWDVWVANPHYVGPPVPHPETDPVDEPWDTDGDTSKWNENGEGQEAENDRYATRAFPGDRFDDEIPSKHNGANQMPIEVDTVVMPAHWACALINDDRTGMTDAEEALMDAFLAPIEAEGWYVVSVADGEEGEPWFTWSYELHGGDAKGGDVVGYIIHKQT